MKVNRTIKILVTALTTCMLMVSGAFGTVADAAKKPVVAEGLQGISVKGSTDLPGHFFLKAKPITAITIRQAPTTITVCSVTLRANG